MEMTKVQTLQIKVSQDQDSYCTLPLELFG